ncbi:MAG: amidohydrolase 2 [Actinomycetia bacterium]|nr:amidohydrolase 2 [Actinomycetes bacterium]
MRDGFKVIDGDGHMMEPHDIWRDYVEAAFQDRIPNVVGDMGRQKHTYGPSEIHPEGFTSMPYVSERFAKAGKEKYGDAFDSYWSLETRLRDMDAEGIDLMVCFPTSGTVATFPGVAPDLQVALCRAYNDWATDFCSGSGGRVKFMAQVSLAMPGAAADEVRRISDRREIAGVMLNDPTFERLWAADEYVPLWTALSDTSLPGGFHGSVSQQFLFRSWTKAGGYAMAVGHTLSFPMEAMASLGGLILGGVLDRHPDLRVGFYEGNAGWVPWFLGRLDMHDTGRQNHYSDGALDLGPTERFRRQCWVAGDSDESTLPAAVEALEGGNLIWNSDYPHLDAGFPGSVDYFLTRDLTDDAKRRILCDNAVALYGERIVKDLESAAGAAAG